MIKKSILTVLLFILNMYLSGDINFDNLSNGTHNVYTLANNGDFNIKTVNLKGGAKIYIIPTDPDAIKSFDYIIVKQNNRYFSPFNPQVELLKTTCDDLFLPPPQNVKTYYIKRGKKNVFEFSGYFISGNYSNSMGPSINEIAMELGKGKGGRLFFEIKKNPSERQMTVLGITKTRGYVQVQINIKPEFFTGEVNTLTQLFPGKNIDLNYNEMAVSFLGEIIREADPAEYDKYKSAILPLEIYSATGKISRTAAAAFKRAFASHFSIANEDRTSTLQAPYVDLSDNNVAAKLYGFDPELKKYDNPYINAYLRFCFYKNKPLTSYYIEQALQKYGSSRKYDYTKYKQISSTEGASIAEAALRYLTWGLEYTPPVNKKRNGTSSFRVFENNYTSLQIWLSNQAIDERSYRNDYFDSTVPRIEDCRAGTDIKKFHDNHSIQFTSPFTEVLPSGAFSTIQGNPLPSATYGIDSPRTFNYKMYEQWRSRLYWLSLMKKNSNLTKNDLYANRFSTMADYIAGKNNYYAGYLRNQNIERREQDFDACNKTFPTYDDNYIKFIYNGNHTAVYPSCGGVKPFVPGDLIRKSNKLPKLTAGPDSPSILGAGVDSPGLVFGAVAMSSLDGSITNVFGLDIVGNLRAYYKMTNQTLGGFADDVSPVSYYLYKEIFSQYYRMKVSDIEKSTVLIPDIKLVQPGDLVVRFEKNKEPYLGVVVKTLWNLTNPYELETLTLNEIMERIVVVSVKPEYQMAFIDYWKSNEKTGNKFAANPWGYHVRRLLKSPSAQNQYHGRDSWELIGRTVDRVVVDVVLPKDKHNKSLNDHWIPNTEEFLEGINFNFSIYERDGSKMKKQALNKAKVGILPPLDQYFKVNEMKDIETQKGEVYNTNIYTNKGAGIDLYAFNKDKLHFLARFKRRTVNEEILQDGSNHYYIDENAESNYVDKNGVSVNNLKPVLDKDGYPQEDYELYIEDGKLIFEDSDGDEFNSFAVKAFCEDNDYRQIRPGDDFLFRFELGDPYCGYIATAKGEDFVAVYDKKMLWRANLYIDERYTLDGKLKPDCKKDEKGLQNEEGSFYDWNDAYPWKINSGIHLNEWNVWVKDWDFSNYTNVMNIPANCYGIRVIQLRVLL